MSRFVELICHLNAFHKIFFIGSVLLRGWVPDGLLEVGDILYLRSHLGRGLPRKSRGCGFWPAQASGARCSEAQFGKSAVDPLAFSSPPRASLRAMVVAATFFVPKQSFQVVFTADNCLCLLQVWSIGLSGCHPPVCSVPWQSFSSMPPFNVPPSLEVGGEPHVQAATREDSLVGRRDQWFWQSCGRWMVFSHGGEMLAEWQTMQMFKMPPPHTHTLLQALFILEDVILRWLLQAQSLKDFIQKSHGGGTAPLFAVMVPCPSIVQASREAPPVGELEEPVQQNRMLALL